MIRYLGAKVRISEQNTKEKSIFLLFSSESTSQTAVKQRGRFFLFDGQPSNKKNRPRCLTTGYSL